eukprot:2934130-Prymnesium_polylepis.1
MASSRGVQGTCSSRPTPPHTTGARYESRGFGCFSTASATVGFARVLGFTFTCQIRCTSASAHVTVLTAVARVVHKRARIGMMTIFSGRVNSTVTYEWGVLY